VSRGLGHVQRGILALIESNPDSAWSMPELCRHLYPAFYPAAVIEKRHRVAVGRAIRNMELPPLWEWRRASKAGSEIYLTNTGSFESTLRGNWLKRRHRWQNKDFDNWKRYQGHIDHARKDVEEALRFHNASPYEKLEIRIGHIRNVVALVSMGGTAAGAEFCKERLKEIVELEAKKKKLGADPVQEAAE
jgi:hypothetical protein